MARQCAQFLAMISRSSRWTAGVLEDLKSRRRSSSAGAATSDRAPPAATPCRRFDAQGADARERLAQAAVALGDQERQAEHAAPQLPFGHDIVAGVGREKRQRQRRIAVLEHDGDRRRQLVDGAIEANGDAAECRHAANSAPCACRAPNGGRRRVRDAGRRCAGARRPLRRRLQNARARSRRGRAAMCRAARPGSDPAGFHLTPRKLGLPPGCCRPVAATVPECRRNQLNIPG